MQDMGAVEEQPIEPIQLTNGGGSQKLTHLVFKELHGRNKPMTSVRAGSWTGPPRGKRAPMAGISSTVFGVTSQPDANSSWRCTCIPNTCRVAPSAKMGARFDEQVLPFSLSLSFSFSIARSLSFSLSLSRSLSLSLFLSVSFSLSLSRCLSLSHTHTHPARASQTPFMPPRLRVTCFWVGFEA